MFDETQAKMFQKQDAQWKRGMIPSLDKVFKD